MYQSLTAMYHCINIHPVSLYPCCMTIQPVLLKCTGVSVLIIHSLLPVPGQERSQGGGANFPLLPHTARADRHLSSLQQCQPLQSISSYSQGCFPFLFFVAYLLDPLGYIQPSRIYNFLEFYRNESKYGQDPILLIMQEVMYLRLGRGKRKLVARKDILHPSTNMGTCYILMSCYSYTS